MDIAWHDKPANHAKARCLAAQAQEAGAELLVMPEMFSTGFSMDVSITAEPIDGPTPELLRALAREMSMAIIGGFVLSRGTGRPQNVALAVGRDGRDLALYRKIHLIALLDENRSYDAGVSPEPFHIGKVGTACFICYDLRFPELFRAVADRCALMVIIASWPFERQGHWDVLLKARAVENQCYVLGVNRVGQGGGHVFTGGSAIIDPLGRVITHAGEVETLMLADIDPAEVHRVRTEMPFLRDRKPPMSF